MKWYLILTLIIFNKMAAMTLQKTFMKRLFTLLQKKWDKIIYCQQLCIADELNVALTEEYGKTIYHYHLHVIAIPVVF